jgi:hypothetical protein
MGLQTQLEFTVNRYSGPRCETCGNAERYCVCNDGRCTSCGEPLDKDAIDAGRDECFDCHLYRND